MNVAVRFSREEEGFLKYLGSYEAWSMYKDLDLLFTDVFRETLVTGDFNTAIQKRVPRLLSMFDSVITDAIKDQEKDIAKNKRLLAEGKFEYPHSEKLLKEDLGDGIRHHEVAKPVLARWRAAVGEVS